MIGWMPLEGLAKAKSLTSLKMQATNMGCGKWLHGNSIDEVE
jgi:hypothetical protein